MVTLSMDAVIEKLLKTINICNNARIEPSGEAKGQPTEVALLDFCVKIGMLDERRVRLLIHFGGENMRFTTLHKYL